MRKPSRPTSGSAQRHCPRSWARALVEGWAVCSEEPVSPKPTPTLCAGQIFAPAYYPLTTLILQNFFVARSNTSLRQLKSASD